ncbi:DUF3857 domain-containing protein [Pontimicrobium aquaticum]|uniref:DUF3857 domain-containing protein n=1 Tax=Pontimicrobium aquaticum TaxID=2565367 RepID=A0A4U0EYB3_9FLAO|nr:DUF3857 domain-containing protein [Pontimicrobium aquaticum]TJY36993.1 DUF3857 domain-containing protein [Pontimicrobium aquaticum]
MNYKNIVGVFLVFTTFNVLSQNNSLAVTEIPEELKKSANAVIRSYDVTVDLSSVNKMIVNTKRIITVLNKEGNKSIRAYERYDNNSKIRDIRAIVYDRFGKEIKKIKKNDFKDVSDVDVQTLYSDSRVKYLDYTPIAYPYTVEYISETVNGTTGYLPRYLPINSYFLSVEKSSYTLNYASNLNIRVQEKNTENIGLIREESSGIINYKTNSINAIKPESHSSPLENIIPKILFASNEFYYEGVPAKAENWNELGDWIYQRLLKDVNDLPTSTIAHVKKLVQNESDDIAKARKIYQYVQDKTRYISVQVGIGGWKPFNASDVDRLGYGDCKGLTNYTMALLEAVGVKANYALVHSGSSQQSFDENFAIMQGNHVILNIPLENDENIWLECTSQKSPFGFIGSFTDNRNVLVVSPEGGEIKRTKKYNIGENRQTISGECNIDSNGNIKIDATVLSEGIQYDDKYYLESLEERDLEKHYKERWSYINNISISKMEIINDKEQIKFKEIISFSASNYLNIVEDKMLLNLNVLNRNTYIPDRYRNRKLPLVIRRGFKDFDEVKISIPKGYKVESIPNDKIIETKFGNYKMSLKINGETTLIYKREFTLNDGEFPKEDYSDFRAFYRNVSKSDSAKLILVKK